MSLGVGRAGRLRRQQLGRHLRRVLDRQPEGRRRRPGAARRDAPNASINALFYATVQATEEAILNAMLAAETMTGADGLRVYALPHDRLLAALRKSGRLK